MADIVERLRIEAEKVEKKLGRVEAAACIETEAADAITALREQLSKSIAREQEVEAELSAAREQIKVKDAMYEVICTKYERSVEQLVEWNRRLAKKDELLEAIRRWAGAYPVDVFPEPDLKAAAKVLEANGMTLDAISASNMRYALNTLLEDIPALQSIKGENNG